MKKEAVQAREQFLIAIGDKASAQSMQRAFAQGGYDAVLHRQTSDAERRSTHQYISPMLLAYLYAQLGQREKTLTLLEAGFRDRDPQLLGIQNDANFDFLHTDERYRSLIKKIGLPPA